MTGRVVVIDDTVSSLLHYLDSVQVHRVDGAVPKDKTTFIGERSWVFDQD